MARRSNLPAIVDDWLSSENIDPDVDALARRQDRIVNSRQLGTHDQPVLRNAAQESLRANIVRFAARRRRWLHGDSLDDTGLTLAFYDQSHLIREVKAFTGLTPSRIEGRQIPTDPSDDGRQAFARR